MCSIGPHEEQEDNRRRVHVPPHIYATYQTQGPEDDNQAIEDDFIDRQWPEFITRIELYTMNLYIVNNILPCRMTEDNIEPWEIW